MIRFFYRFISTTVLIAFTATNTVLAAPAGTQLADRNSQVGEPQTAKDELRLISPDLGSVEERHVGKSDKTIYYIQDAHDSLEAQENIAKIIDSLIKDRGVTTVFEEGYEGPVPTDKYFANIPEPDVRQKLSYFLLDKLRIGAAEYAHINRDKTKGDFQLIGADSIKLYLENLISSRQNFETQKQTEQDLAKISKYLTQLQNKYFPKALKEQLKLRERFDNKQLGLADYLFRLAKLGSRGEGIGDSKNKTLTPTPQPLPPSLNILLTYLTKTQLTKEESKQLEVQLKAIDAKTLFQELDQFEQSLVNKSLNGGQKPEDNARNQKTYRYSKAIGLLQRLNHLEVTTEEYEAVIKSRSQLAVSSPQIKNELPTANNELLPFKTEELADFIFANTKQSLVLSKHWETNIQNAIQFYELAKLRDLSIESALNTFLSDKSQKETILVFGGFHKEGIKALLKKLNVSYTILSPKITKEDTVHKAYYKQLMTVGFHNYEMPKTPANAARILNAYLLLLDKAQTVFDAEADTIREHRDLVYAVVKPFLEDAWQAVISVFVPPLADGKSMGEAKGASLGARVAPISGYYVKEGNRVVIQIGKPGTPGARTIVARSDEELAQNLRSAQDLNGPIPDTLNIRIARNEKVKNGFVFKPGYIDIFTLDNHRVMKWNDVPAILARLQEMSPKTLRVESKAVGASLGAKPLHLVSLGKREIVEELIEPAKALEKLEALWDKHGLDAVGLADSAGKMKSELDHVRLFAVSGQRNFAAVIPFILQHLQNLSAERYFYRIEKASYKDSAGNHGNIAILVPLVELDTTPASVDLSEIKARGELLGTIVSKSLGEGELHPFQIRMIQVENKPLFLKAIQNQNWDEAMKIKNTLTEASPVAAKETVMDVYRSVLQSLTDEIPIDRIKGKSRPAMLRTAQLLHKLMEWEKEEDFRLLANETYDPLNTLYQQAQDPILLRRLIITECQLRFEESKVAFEELQKSRKKSPAQTEGPQLFWGLGMVTAQQMINRTEENTLKEIETTARSNETLRKEVEALQEVFNTFKAAVIKAAGHSGLPRPTTINVRRVIKPELLKETVEWGADELWTYLHFADLKWVSPPDYTQDPTLLFYLLENASEKVVVVSRAASAMSVPEISFMRLPADESQEQMARIIIMHDKVDPKIRKSLDGILFDKKYVNPPKDLSNEKAILSKEVVRAFHEGFIRVDLQRVGILKVYEKHTLDILLELQWNHPSTWKNFLNYLYIRATSNKVNALSIQGAGGVYGQGVTVKDIVKLCHLGEAAFDNSAVQWAIRRGTEGDPKIDTLDITPPTGASLGAQEYYASINTEEILKELLARKGPEYNRFEEDSRVNERRKWIGTALKGQANNFKTDDLIRLESSLLRALGKVKGLSARSIKARETITETLAVVAKRVDFSQLSRMILPLQNALIELKKSPVRSRASDPKMKKVEINGIQYEIIVQIQKILEALDAVSQRVDARDLSLVASALPHVVNALPRLTKKNTSDLLDEEMAARKALGVLTAHIAERVSPTEFPSLASFIMDRLREVPAQGIEAEEVQWHTADGLAVILLREKGQDISPRGIRWNMAQDLLALSSEDERGSRSLFPDHGNLDRVRAILARGGDKKTMLRAFKAYAREIKRKAQRAPISGRSLGVQLTVTVGLSGPAGLGGLIPRSGKSLGATSFKVGDVEVQTAQAAEVVPVDENEVRLYNANNVELVVKAVVLDDNTYLTVGNATYLVLPSTDGKKVADLDTLNPLGNPQWFSFMNIPFNSHENLERYEHFYLPIIERQLNEGSLRLFPVYKDLYPALIPSQTIPQSVVAESRAELVKMMDGKVLSKMKKNEFNVLIFNFRSFLHHLSVVALNGDWKDYHQAQFLINALLTTKEIEIPLSIRQHLVNLSDYLLLSYDGVYWKKWKQIRQDLKKPKAKGVTGPARAWTLFERTPDAIRLGVPDPRQWRVAKVRALTKKDVAVKPLATEKDDKVPGRQQHVYKTGKRTIENAIVGHLGFAGGASATVKELMGRNKLVLYAMKAKTSLNNEEWISLIQARLGLVLGQNNKSKIILATGVAGAIEGESDYSTREVLTEKYPNEYASGQIGTVKQRSGLILDPETGEPKRYLDGRLAVTAENHLQAFLALLLDKENVIEFLEKTTGILSVGNTDNPLNYARAGMAGEIAYAEEYENRPIATAALLTEAAGDKKCGFAVEVIYENIEDPTRTIIKNEFREMSEFPTRVTSTQGYDGVKLDPVKDKEAYEAAGKNKWFIEDILTDEKGQPVAFLINVAFYAVNLRLDIARIFGFDERDRRSLIRNLKAIDEQTWVNKILALGEAVPRTVQPAKKVPNENNTDEVKGYITEQAVQDFIVNGLALLQTQEGQVSPEVAFLSGDRADLFLGFKGKPVPFLDEAGNITELPLDPKLTEAQLREKVADDLLGLTGKEREAFMGRPDAVKYELAAHRTKQAYDLIVNQPGYKKAIERSLKEGQECVLSLNPPKYVTEVIPVYSLNEIKKANVQFKPAETPLFLRVEKRSHVASKAALQQAAANAKILSDDPSKLDVVPDKVEVTTRRNEEINYGVTVVVGRPFAGEVDAAIQEWTQELTELTGGLLKIYNARSYATFFPFVRSQATPVVETNLSGIDFDTVLDAFKTTQPFTIKFKGLQLSTERDGGLALVGELVASDDWHKLQTTFENAHLSLKFKPQAKIWVTVGDIDTEALEKMAPIQAYKLKRWIKRHAQIKPLSFRADSARLVLYSNRKLRTTVAPDITLPFGRPSQFENGAQLKDELLRRFAGASLGEGELHPFQIAMIQAQNKPFFLKAIQNQNWDEAMKIKNALIKATSPEAAKETVMDVYRSVLQSLANEIPIDRIKGKSRPAMLRTAQLLHKLMEWEKEEDLRLLANKTYDPLDTLYQQVQDPILLRRLIITECQLKFEESKAAFEELQKSRKKPPVQTEGPQLFWGLGMVTAQQMLNRTEENTLKEIETTARSNETLRKEVEALQEVFNTFKAAVIKAAGHGGLPRPTTLKDRRVIKPELLKETVEWGADELWSYLRFADLKWVSPPDYTQDPTLHFYLLENAYERVVVVSRMVSAAVPVSEISFMRLSADESQEQMAPIIIMHDKSLNDILFDKKYVNPPKNLSNEKAMLSKEVVRAFHEGFIRVDLQRAGILKVYEKHTLDILLELQWNHPLTWNNFLSYLRIRATSNKVNALSIQGAGGIYGQGVTVKDIVKLCHLGEAAFDNSAIQWAIRRGTEGDPKIDTLDITPSTGASYEDYASDKSSGNSLGKQQPQDQSPSFGRAFIEGRARNNFLAALQNKKWDEALKFKQALIEAFPKDKDPQEHIMLVYRNLLQSLVNKMPSEKMPSEKRVKKLPSRKAESWQAMMDIAALLNKLLEWKEDLRLLPSLLFDPIFEISRLSEANRDGRFSALEGVIVDTLTEKYYKFTEPGGTGDSTPPFWGLGNKRAQNMFTADPTSTIEQIEALASPGSPLRQDVANINRDFEDFKVAAVKAAKTGGRVHSTTTVIPVKSTPEQLKNKPVWGAQDLLEFLRLHTTHLIWVSPDDYTQDSALHFYLFQNDLEKVVVVSRVTSYLIRPEVSCMRFPTLESQEPSETIVFGEKDEKEGKVDPGIRASFGEILFNRLNVQPPENLSRDRAMLTSQVVRKFHDGFIWWDLKQAGIAQIYPTPRMQNPSGSYTWDTLLEIQWKHPHEWQKLLRFLSFESKNRGVNALWIDPSVPLEKIVKYFSPVPREYPYIPDQFSTDVKKGQDSVTLDIIPHVPTASDEDATNEGSGRSLGGGDQNTLHELGKRINKNARDREIISQQIGAFEITPLLRGQDIPRLKEALKKLEEENIKLQKQFDKLLAKASSLGELTGGALYFKGDEEQAEAMLELGKVWPVVKSLRVFSKIPEVKSVVIDIRDFGNRYQVSCEIEPSEGGGTSEISANIVLPDEVAKLKAAVTSAKASPADLKRGASLGANENIIQQIVNIGKSPAEPDSLERDQKAENRINSHLDWMRVKSVEAQLEEVARKVEEQRAIVAGFVGTPTPESEKARAKAETALSEAEQKERDTKEYLDGLRREDVGISGILTGAGITDVREQFEVIFQALEQVKNRIKHPTAYYGLSLGSKGASDVTRTDRGTFKVLNAKRLLPETQIPSTRRTNRDIEDLGFKLRAKAMDYKSSVVVRAFERDHDLKDIFDAQALADRLANDQKDEAELTIEATGVDAERAIREFDIFIRVLNQDLNNIPSGRASALSLGSDLAPKRIEQEIDDINRDILPLKGRLGLLTKRANLAKPEQYGLTLEDKEDAQRLLTDVVVRLKVLEGRKQELIALRGTLGGTKSNADGKSLGIIEEALAEKGSFEGYYPSFGGIGHLIARKVNSPRTPKFMVSVRQENTPVLPVRTQAAVSFIDEQGVSIGNIDTDLAISHITYNAYHTVEPRKIEGVFFKEEGDGAFVPALQQIVDQMASDLEAGKTVRETLDRAEQAIKQYKSVSKSLGGVNQGDLDTREARAFRDESAAGKPRAPKFDAVKEATFNEAKRRHQEWQSELDAQIDTENDASAGSLGGKQSHRERIRDTQKVIRTIIATESSAKIASPVPFSEEEVAAPPTPTMPASLVEAEALLARLQQAKRGLSLGQKAPTVEEILNNIKTPVAVFAPASDLTDSQKKKIMEYASANPKFIRAVFYSAVKEELSGPESNIIFTTKGAHQSTLQYKQERNVLFVHKVSAPKSVMALTQGNNLRYPGDQDDQLTGVGLARSQLSADQLRKFDEDHGIQPDSDGFISIIAQALGELVRQHEAAQVARIAA